MSFVESNSDNLHAELKSSWRSKSLTHVPYWVYQDRFTYSNEHNKIFRGETWNYVCLSAEIPNVGDYVTTYVGRIPVIVVRGDDREIYGFENRCAHRGALLAVDDRGHTDDFVCLYHAWAYDKTGALKNVAFKDGVNGLGGMPASFNCEEHSLNRLRISIFQGLVFASFDNFTPPIEIYLGEEIGDRIKRVIQSRNIKILGRFTQVLPYNWKLYCENVRDSYHASILHTFFTTFEINRLSQKGGVVVSENGGCHASYSLGGVSRESDDTYRDEKIRSESDIKLSAPEFLEGFHEFADNGSLQILSVFPGFVLQQISNSIAIRQVIPREISRTELNWTFIGFSDDDASQENIRILQANLAGPAGFISMEDGCIGDFVQRAIVEAEADESVIQMGGFDAVSSPARTNETAIRGFWKIYRSLMGE